MTYGARLRQAREFARLTQKGVQDEIGLNQGRLSQAERDAYVLSESALVEFAALTGFPPGFFETPPTIRIDSDPVHFRSRASMRASEANQAVRGGELLAEAALVMLGRLEGPALNLPTDSFSTDPAELAFQTRTRFGVTAVEPLRNLLILLEQAGVLVLGVPLEANRRDAFSFWLDDHPTIALLDTDAGDRQLWSTAHELGHLLLHRGVGASPEVEQQADEFAMHLLIPPAALAPDMPQDPKIQQLAMLKQRWGVSIAALVRAAKRLERIDEHRYTSLFRQMSARGERLRERSAINPLKPRGFRAMSEALYGANPTQRLAEDVNWTLSFTEDVMCRHATADDLPIRPGSNVVSLEQARFARG